ncbi:MAG: hypothetical protein KA802_11365 [Saprospiraceae bacterium]|nr:hypothetical protein [Saprospiraceae bacterium]
MKKNLVFLTGAGISADAGIPTYRDPDGLWTKYDQNIVSKKGSFETDTGKEFWSLVFKDLDVAKYTIAHKIIQDLEKDYNVIVITTNIDDLHEKAGSANVIHIHGLYNQFREDGKTPNVVLFGEDVQSIGLAYSALHNADIFVSVGTSDNVMPASDFINELGPNCKKIQFNKEKTKNTPLFDIFDKGKANTKMRYIRTHLNYLKE